MSSDCSGCSSCSPERQDSPNCRRELFPPEPVRELDAEQEAFKRHLYESMNPRRRKFIDKIGYEQWDPFQQPKDPLDMRRDATNRTLQELLRDFMAENGQGKDIAWQTGVRECALGIIRKDERFQGIFDFCLWYDRMLRKNEPR